MKGLVWKLVPLLAGSAVCQAAAQRPLDVYHIDVEGGKATLVIAPSGESLLFAAEIGPWAHRRALGRPLRASLSRARGLRPG